MKVVTHLGFFPCNEMISKKNVTRFVETLRVNEEYEEPVALHLVSSRKA